MPRSTEPLLAGYTFVPALHAYRNLATGRTVARTKILDLLDGQINQREARLGRITLDFQAGRLQPAQWVEIMRNELRRAAIENRALGAGGLGPNRLTPHDYGAIGHALRDDYRRLAAFAQQIAAGELSDAQILNRLGMYLGNARIQFWTAEQERLKPSKPGYVILGKRVLGVAEHCFPAGTLILTPTGEKPIEKISTGDYVETQFGAREVTRIYQREYSGDFISLIVDGHRVTCTNNHPFLTERGWIAAGNLLPDDRVVLFNGGAHHIDRQVRFPYTDYDITTGRQINVLGRITASLFDLPLCQWFKSRMFMPVIAVSLDNETPHPKIDDKLGLDKSLRFILDTKSIENRCKSFFKFGWLRTQSQGIAGDKSSDVFWPAADETHTFRRSWQTRWIMRRQIGSGSAVNLFGIYCMIKHYTNAIGAVLNMGTSAIWQGIKASIGTSAWKSFADNSIFFGRPGKSSNIMLAAISRLAITSMAAIGTYKPRYSIFAQLSFPAVLTKVFCSVSAKPTNWTSSRMSSVSSFEKYNSAATLTRSGTETPRLIVARNLTLKGSTAYLAYGLNKSNFAGSLSHDNAPQVLYSESQKNAKVLVYNLEVADAHQYVANGFVVHNCDSCILYARAGWRYIQDVIPPGTKSECLTNCRCSVITREVPIAEAAALVGSGEIPEWNASEGAWEGFNPAHEPPGSSIGGRFARIGGGTFTPTEDRVWTGSAATEASTLSKLEVGARGEALAAHVLAELHGGALFGSLNSGLNNAPVDLAGDHSAVEVKTGLASNGKSAQHWRATIGQPGKAETAALRQMTADQKAAHNVWKGEAILARKQALIAKLSAEAGVPIRPYTVGVILSPDGRRGDVWVMPGFHLRIGWNTLPAAHAAEYVGTWEIGSD